ncbi:MAG: hypothetical protein WDO68_18630 [Gammaproteobacteria bacterium]
MLSEDTGTQGRGNLELELGSAWSRAEGVRAFLFQPQLSYGVSPALDLIVQPSWLMNDGRGGQEARGFGDTNVDAKWRFQGAAPFSLGVRAGFALPTAQGDLGLPSGRISPHATLVATVDATPFTLDANLGYARAPHDGGERADLWHFSAAALFATSARLSFVLDAGIDSNPDSTRTKYPAVALLGVIYTAFPGLDFDSGYRARLNSVAPSGQWLLGVTYRGAP